MGAGPIPWTAINEYAIRYDVEGDEFDRLVRLIQHMDGIYLNQSSPATKR